MPSQRICELTGQYKGGIVTGLRKVGASGNKPIARRCFDLIEVAPWQ